MKKTLNKIAYAIWGVTTPPPTPRQRYAATELLRLMTEETQKRADQLQELNDKIKEVTQE